MSRAVCEELRRAGVSDVDASSLTRAMYSSDASLYRVVPQLVVRPRHGDELLASMEVARAAGVPVTVRGAGTSIAGNAVGAGMVLDTTRHLNRVLTVDPEARTASVQPGVVHAHLQQEVRRHGLRFGPDPSSHTRCTIGGMLGNNACGSRALGYGRTVDTVVALDVVTGGGERLVLGGHGAVPGAPAATAVVAAAEELVIADLSTVRTELGRFRRQLSGFGLQHLLPENGRRLDRALVGSEGTLAVVLEATVSLVTDPAATALVVLGYPSMAEAADAVPTLLQHPMTACEGMDSRIVDVVLGRRGSAALPRMPRGAGWLLVEVTGEGPAQAASAAAAVVASAGALDARVVTDPVEQLALWRVREDGAGLAARSPVPSGRPGQSGWEDSAVPPERLGAYLRSFDALLDDYGYAGVPYGHFGEGCVHVRIDFGLSSAQGRTSFRSFLTAAAGLVASYGGSLSGEHGDGRARSELLPAMYSPQALSLFERFKALLDPDDVLNPGVLVRPRPVDADLRLARPLREPVASLRLVEDAGSLVDAVHRCTGVGRCLADNTGSGGVMCPSYLATRREKDSTRGRARVLQEMVNGDVVSGGWRAPEVHEALELCLACKGCSSDCPTGVDMATYKVEALHARYRRRIRPRSHYALGQLPRWLRRGTAVAPLANRLLSSPLAGDAVKVAAGVDRRRALPELTGRSFRSWAAGRPDPADPEVVVWADTFTDHLAAGVGEALVAVLEGAGLRVGVVGEEACCGLTWLSTGQLAGARRAVAGAVEALHPYVARGVPVVGAEPSCVAALRSDAVQLTSDPRATEVARGVLTLAEMLSRRQGWRPPDLAGLEVVVQPHCHHASVLGWEADALLLAATGAQVTRVGGCCGLAGSWGMEKGHYEVSVAIAEHSLLPAVREAGKDAVVVADGFSCRTQLTDLAGVRAVHLAELLVGRHGGRASG